MSGIFSGNDIEITGATDGTNIGNVGDALKVFSDPKPDKKLLYLSSPLLNGAAKDMDVNGSIVNQTFEYGPTGTNIEYVTRLRMVLSDGNIKNPTRFGDINSVSNGLLVRYVLNSTNIDFYNFIDNTDLASAFKIETSNFSNNLATEKPLVVLISEFSTPVRLEGTVGDKFQAIVRDNLTGLDILRMNIDTFREL